MPDSLPRIQRIQSSSVDAIGYDPEGGRLYVRFIGSGHAYVYRGVPDAVYQSLMGAESKGRFVNERIKGAYETRPLRGRPENSLREFSRRRGGADRQATRHGFVT